jgi:hypothetical protein
MKWISQAASVGEIRNAYKFGTGNPEENYIREWEIILKLILKKQDARMWIGFM